MTDEPTPPSIQDSPVPLGVEPPPIVERPRNPIGWIASLALLLLLIVGAVAGYIDQTDGEESQTVLQQTLKQQVSLTHNTFPIAEKLLGESGKEGLNSVLESAVESSKSSDEAARIAVVTARELGEDPPAAALERLVGSKDSTSRTMARIYSGIASEEETDTFIAIKSQEFAVELAQIQAQEALGRDVDRGSIIDQGMLTKTMVVGIGGLCLVAIGAVCLVMFFVMNSSGKVTPVGLGSIEKSDGDRYMIKFALYLMLFLGAGAGVASLQNIPALSRVGETWWSVIVMSVALIGFVGIISLSFIDRKDSLLSVLGDSRPLWKQVRAGVFGYFCSLPLLMLALLIIAGLSQILPSPTHPISEEMATAGGLDWLAIAFAAAVLAPLVEELSFRGLLYPALTTQLRKPWVAIVVSGLIFAAIHPQGPLAWPALATTGAAAATLRYYTGSLIPSIVLHMLHNGVIVVVGFLVG